MEDERKLRGGEVVGWDADIRGDPLGYGVGHIVVLEVGMSLNPSEDDGEIDVFEKVPKQEVPRAKGVVVGVERESGGGLEDIKVGASGEIVYGVNERLGKEVNVGVKERNDDGVDFARVRAFNGRGGGKNSVVVSFGDKDYSRAGGVDVVGVVRAVRVAYVCLRV